MQSVELIWDSSGSGARRNHTEELAVLDAYFRAFPDVQVRLLRLRDVMEPSIDFSVVRGDWRELRRELQATVYDGGTNFDALACSVQQPCASVTERLLFTDGLDTLGSAPLGRSPVPLQIINAAVNSDPARLNALAGRSNGVSLNLLQQPAADAAARLIGAPQRPLEVEASGAAQLTVREDRRSWYVSGRAHLRRRHAPRTSSGRHGDPAGPDPCGEGGVHRAALGHLDGGGPACRRTPQPRGDPPPGRALRPGHARHVPAGA